MGVIRNGSDLLGGWEKRATHRFDGAERVGHPKGSMKPKERGIHSFRCG
jgi:hypothetical protein